MLSRLLDQYNATIGRSRYELKWSRILDTFRLKYQQVEVWRMHLDGNDIPGAFIVWRDQAGTYSVDLYASAREVRRRIEFYKTVNGNLAGPAGKDRFPELISDVRYVGEGGLINWGIFDYECRCGVGEFLSDRDGMKSIFPNFVLKEERSRFL